MTEHEDVAPTKDAGVRQLGPRIVREVFGGPFYQQGRGYYVALEFFAIAKGVLDIPTETGEDQLLRNDHRVPLVYRRTSLDFARRLMHGASLGTGSESKLRGRDTTRALQVLLEGLECNVPGRINVPKNWQQRHFYPYPPEFIHYDAVIRRNKISVERYTYRGAGAFAYRVLATDPDPERLARTRAGLRDLLGPSGAALGRIATALAALDECEAKEFEDNSDVVTIGDDLQPSDTRWAQLLREGVDTILRRKVPKFRRIEALMNWIPLCVAFHQHERALRFLEREEMRPLVFDAGLRTGPVRSQSKQDLRAAILVITEALEKRAEDESYARLRSAKSQSWKTDPRAFFTGTLYAAGAMNALKGADRFFATTAKLLETLVLALVTQEMTFEDFCLDVLYRRAGFVTDVRAMDAARVSRIESSYMESNSEELAKRLLALGLLKAYSDATRMVSVEE